VRAVVAVVGALLLGGCATPPPASAPPVTVVTFGDSVPAGTACHCTPFPDLYARMVSPAADSENLSEAGATSADVRRTLSGAHARDAVRRATVVLVMAGANDVAAALDDDDPYAAPVAQVGRNMTAVLRSVHDLRPGVPVLVIGYWNVVEDGVAAGNDDSRRAAAGAATAACDHALREAAAATGATYVDTLPVFKGGTGTGDPTALLAADGDHPNAAGHEAIASAAYAAAH
jgi:acyl-CoA thioesterase-1